MLDFLGSQTILCNCRVLCRVEFDYPKSVAYSDILLYYICCTFWVVKLYSAIAKYWTEYSAEYFAEYVAEHCAE